jgi:hypothetical protein
MEIAIKNYIKYAGEISVLLGDLSHYSIKRTDYCMNFYLPELNVNCTQSQMMELIKRGNIPVHYNEWKKYDKKSHRMVSSDDTLYLKSNSVTINCYDKHSQLEKEYPDNPSIGDSKDIIRFEVQCKYLKVYNMAKKYADSHTISNFQLLSDNVTKDVITSYYKRIVRQGDYYTLPEAKRIIEDKCFSVGKEDRLIDTLELINQARGISKAKDKVPPERVCIFNQSLRELSEMRINPVTIPREWNVKFIPNLLRKYYDTSY